MVKKEDQDQEFRATVVDLALGGAPEAAKGLIAVHEAAKRINEKQKPESKKK